ncbi:hypothetical protein FRC10_012315 [Ceratobasidium sp. 414]|nr:hypothetical protein FRC10_012315 [Ceratobasidium sp. 414]
MSVLSVETSATTTAEKPVEGHTPVTDTDAQTKVEDADQVTPATPQVHAGDEDIEELLLKIRELYFATSRLKLVERLTGTLEKLDVGGERKPEPPQEESGSQPLPSRGPEVVPDLTNYTCQPRLEPQPRSKGFVLELVHANMLLLNQVFFLVFPNVYVFDKHRIVCCVDSGNRYLEADSLKPNPPEPETIFHLEDMPYWFDPHNQLWYNLGGQWYPETTYSDLPSARAELARCAERNRLVAHPVASTSTSATRTISEANHSPHPQSPSSDDEYLYPPLGARPGRAQIDAWFEEFKSRRAALQKTRERLSEIRCPLEECRKPQRRPQALRDHLYFHFGIKLNR